MTGLIRKEFVFHGRVQGVGFRFTTQKVSARFEVLGWVRNLSDGSVKVVAEGNSEQVEGFAAAIAQAIATSGFGSIDSTKSRDLDVCPGEFSLFEIRT